MVINYMSVIPATGEAKAGELREHNGKGCSMAKSCHCIQPGERGERKTIMPEESPSSDKCLFYLRKFTNGEEENEWINKFICFLAI